jgi:hypothetical protein
MHVFIIFVLLITILACRVIYFNTAFKEGLESHPPKPIISDMSGVNMRLKELTNRIIGLSIVILQDKPMREGTKFFTNISNLKEATEKISSLNELNKNSIAKINNKNTKIKISETVSPNKKELSKIVNFSDIQPWIADLDTNSTKIGVAIRPYIIGNLKTIVWDKIPN